MVTSAAISTSIGYTTFPGTSATTVVCQPPPAYNSGDFLLMTALGAGTAVSFPSTPSGWTALTNANVGTIVDGTPAQNMVTIYNYLLANGYSAMGAAGVTVCIGGESNWNPEAIETPGSPSTGGCGLIQWTPGTKMESYGGTCNAAGIGSSSNNVDMQNQLAAIVSFNGTPGNWGGGGSLAGLNSQTTVTAAADYYSQYLEEPVTLYSDVTTANVNAVTAIMGGMGVFYKTAGSESAYTVTFSAASEAEVQVTAYPPATVASTASYISGTEATSYQTGVPGGITSGQQVVLCAGAVDSASTDNGAFDSNIHNMNLPANWAWTLMPFGSNTAGVSNYLSSCIGIAEYTGTFTAPKLTSNQGSTFYTFYVVLNIPTPATPLSVTATCSGPGLYDLLGGSVDIYGDVATPGMALSVVAVTGAQLVANIVASGATASDSGNGSTLVAPEYAITPNSTGSELFGALWIYNEASPFTAASTTTFFNNVNDTGNSGSPTYGTFKYNSTTTAGSPVTLGATAPTNKYASFAAAEILAQTTLANIATASTFGTALTSYVTGTVAQTVTFATEPSANSLLVATVACNANWNTAESVVETTITDSMGLTWTQLVNTNLYAPVSVWIAPISPQTPPNPPSGPSSGPSAFSMLLTPESNVLSCAVEETQATVPVIPGQQLLVQAYVYCAGSEFVELGMNWYDVNMTLISSTTQLFPATDSEWVQVKTVVTAPLVTSITQGAIRCGRNGQGTSIAVTSTTYIDLLEVIYPTSTW